MCCVGPEEDVFRAISKNLAGIAGAHWLARHTLVLIITRRRGCTIAP